MDAIHSRPLTPAGRENYDRIFRRTDPAHSLTSGTIREYRSDCCGAFPIMLDGLVSCGKCHLPCVEVLTKINP